MDVSVGAVLVLLATTLLFLVVLDLTVAALYAIWVLALALSASGLPDWFRPLIEGMAARTSSIECARVARRAGTPGYIAWSFWLLDASQVTLGKCYPAGLSIRRWHLLARISRMTPIQLWRHRFARMRAWGYDLRVWAQISVASFPAFRKIAPLPQETTQTHRPTLFPTGWPTDTSLN